jgi:sec-independent protein translocase protein TatC
MQETDMTFWEHLDVLRSVLIKTALAVVACGLLAFFFKDTMFDIVLAPKDSSFVTYRLFQRIGSQLQLPAMDLFSIKLINTGLAEQFLIHMKTAVGAGFLLASPYIIYQLFLFVSPALYEQERKYSFRIVASGYLMFLLGVMVGYFLIFPLTLRFLGTYQVSAEVENMISLQSYIGTFMMMNLLMGIVFELPVLCWFLGRLGLLNSRMMRHFRKHAIVAILIVAAIITPTSDVFTLLLVSFPIWLLYEISIHVVKKPADRSVRPR